MALSTLARYTYFQRNWDEFSHVSVLPLHGAVSRPQTTVMELRLGQSTSANPNDKLHDCQICDDISKCLAGTLGFYHNYDLGLLKDLLEPTCIFHSSFFQTLQHYLDEPFSASEAAGSDEAFGRWEPTDRLELSYHVAESSLASDPNSRLQLAIYKDTSELSPEQSGKDRYLLHYLLLLKRPDIQRHPGNARVPDPDWIDLDQIRTWISRCSGKHGEACDNTMQIIRRPPSLLVDIRRMCIVDGKPEHRYFALSYRIGRPGAFVLRSGNLEELRKGNALRRPDTLNQLQLTVKHALSLASALGADYLWVDVLCIVHDGTATTADQLSSMASIYSNAWTTIIVADGEGSDGIRGLRNVSKPRDLQQPIFEYRDERLIMESENRVQLNYGTRYFGRAWTHQEYHMSCRRLVIHSGQAHWLCATYLHHEYLVDGHGQNLRIDVLREGNAMYGQMTKPHLHVSGIPDLQSLFHSELARYNRKELTYPQDAQAAVSGLLAVYSRTFQGGFLYGLPELLFDAAIGWDSAKEMERRRGATDPSHISLGPSALPSWSWLGWTGRFSLGSHEPCNIDFMHLPGRRMRETSPITDWYTSDSPVGQHGRKIESTWLRDRDDFKDLGQTLPEGWNRIAAKDLDLIEGKKCPQAVKQSAGYVYEHEGLTKYFRYPKYWKHPFPIPTIDASTPLVTPEQTRFLFCKTWKTSVYASPRYINRPSAANIFDFRQEHDGPVIGRLCMAGPPPFEYEDRSFDIVAVSKLVDHAFTPTIKDYRMIKVLWVKWKEGIAYRHGSGEVDEGAWNALAREEIELVLG